MIKDTHPSISNMIWMASVTDPDHIGESSNSFKSFYNSKNQGYTDLDLHNQFNDKALHNMDFAEGMVLALWLGLLKQSNPTTPSNCTPFTFKELMPINTNQKSCSFIITLVNQKGSLSQTSEEIKAKAKQDIAAPSNYNEMVFQLKAFLALLEKIFGVKSIVAEKIRGFVKLIKRNSIYYKGCLYHDKFFPTKVMWTVCCHFQLFLVCCQKADDREEVDDSLLAFTSDHRDIMMGRFNATLPPSFKVVATKDKETNDNGTKDKKGTKKRKSDEKKETRKKTMAESIITNEQQCGDFKLNHDEKWKQFAGKKLNQQAKLNGTIMCTRCHTPGNCFKDCKNRASHIACSKNSVRG
jgi:hypothetical protein